MSELATYRTVLEEFFAAGLHALLSGFVRDNMARFTPPNPDAPVRLSHLSLSHSVAHKTDTSTSLSLSVSPPSLPPSSIPPSLRQSLPLFPPSPSFLAVQEEQSHANFELFKEFSALVEDRLGELLAERTPALRDAAQKERQGQRHIERQRQRQSQIERQRQSDEEKEQYRAPCAPHLPITTYIPA